MKKEHSLEVQELRARLAKTIRELRRVSREAKRDELTGLRKTRNFAYWCVKAIRKHREKREQAETAGAEKQRKNNSYFIVSIDMDGLKSANDTPAPHGGYDVGDRIIAMLSNTVRVEIRRDDLFMRRHGDRADEFVLFFSGATLENVERSLVRIRDKFEATAEKRFPELYNLIGISFSYGIREIFPEDGEDAIRAKLKDADYFMKRRKRERKADRRVSFL